MNGNRPPRKIFCSKVFEIGADDEEYELNKREFECEIEISIVGKGLRCSESYFREKNYH